MWTSRNTAGVKQSLRPASFPDYAVLGPREVSKFTAPYANFVRAAQS